MKKVLLILFAMLFFSVFAKDVAIFDFSKDGDDEASNILKTYIEYSTLNRCHKAIAYYYDIDDDGINEIIGYVQNGLYYSLKGYQLIVLKKEESNNAIKIDDINWTMKNSNLYFNPYYPVEIKGKQITYKEGDLYKNRQRSATISNGNIDIGYDFEGHTGRQIRNIEEVTKFSSGAKQNKIDINDFGVGEKKRYSLDYKNLNEKTKHYLEMK